MSSILILVLVKKFTDPGSGIVVDAIKVPYRSVIHAALDQDVTMFFEIVVAFIRYNEAWLHDKEPLHGQYI